MRFLLMALGWIGIAGAVGVAWILGKSEVATGCMLVGVVFLAAGYLFERD